MKKIILIFYLLISINIYSQNNCNEIGKSIDFYDSDGMSYFYAEKAIDYLICKGFNKVDATKKVNEFIAISNLFEHYRSTGLNLSKKYAIGIKCNTNDNQENCKIFDIYLINKNNFNIIKKITTRSDNWGTFDGSYLDDNLFIYEKIYFFDSKLNIYQSKYTMGNFYYGGKYIPVENEEKYGFIDRKGKLVIGFEYDYVDNFFSNRALVRIEDKYGFIDENGKQIIECKYDGAESFENEIARVNIKSNFFYINTKGECVKDCENAPTDHPRANN